MLYKLFVQDLLQPVYMCNSLIKLVSVSVWLIMHKAMYSLHKSFAQAFIHNYQHMPLF